MITLELDDPTAYAYVRVGECYQELNQIDIAISFYKKAVHEDPLLDKGWILLTNAYHSEKDYQKALYYISKALKIDESNALYWRKYSEINIKLSFYEEAIKGFEKCIELKDESIEIYIALSDVLLFIGEFINAQKIYKDFAEIEYRLAGLFFVLNKENYGITHLINGMKVDFGYHSIIQELFPTVYDNLKFKKIVADYKKATE